MAVLNITNEEQFLNEVTNCSQPVVVDFSAEWCAPCQALMPMLEEMSSEVKVVNIDVDRPEVRSLVQQHQIRSIPATFVYDKGEVVYQHIGGALDKASLQNNIPK